MNYPRPLCALRSMAWLLLLCTFPSVFLYARGAAPNLVTTSNVISVVKDGSDVTLTCTANDSNTTFAWYFDNAPVMTNMRVTTTDSSRSSTLSVSSVTRDDSGWYTCRGTNIDGYNYKDFVVAVGALPTIRTENQPATVNTTANIVVPFACLVDAIPSPLIQWYRSDMPGQEVPTCGSSPGDVCVDDTADFQLVVNATAETVDVDYYCTGTNSLGMIESRRARIKQLPDPPPSQTPPASSLMPFYRTLASDRVNLVCHNATGASPPSVSWTLNGAVVSGETGNTITIQGADTHGVYCCQLSPPGGQPTLSYCTYVLPQSDPDIVTSPPSLIAVEAGRSIGMVCEANGVTDPEVDWLLGMNVLESGNNSRYSITAGSDNYRLSHFLLSGAESMDAGMYKCRALNFISTTTEAFQISVVSPTAEGNLLSDPGAEFSSSQSPWEYQTRQGTQQMAKRKRVNGENVFQLGYKESMSMDDLYISQSFTIPANVIMVRVSARMRQSSTTTVSAAPLLTLQDSTTSSYYMDWVEPSGTAWQWASLDVPISAALIGVDHNATVIMNVTFSSGVMPDGVVYFDDVSVAPIAVQSPTDSLLIYVIAGAAGGVVLIVVVLTIILIVCCCCCYYCGCFKRRNKAEPMRKESTKKRFSRWTARYAPSRDRPSIDDVIASQDSQNYAVLLDTAPESHYTSPKDPLYETLGREGNSQPVNTPNATEMKDYYYIQQPASVPDRKVSSISSSSFLGPPANRTKSASQSSLASRELPTLPDVDVTDIASPEPNVQYLQLLPAFSPPAADKQEVVDNYANASLQFPSKRTGSMDPLTEGQEEYANEETVPQPSHPAVGRQPTYEYVEAGPSASSPPQNGHPAVSHQPTYEYARPEPSHVHPPLDQRPSLEEVYEDMPT